MTLFIVHFLNYRYFLFCTHVPGLRSEGPRLIATYLLSHQIDEIKVITSVIHRIEKDELGLYCWHFYIFLSDMELGKWSGG